MIEEIIVVIVVILALIWLFCIFILLPIHLVQEVFGQEIELKCLIFSDGKTAVVKANTFYGHGYSDTCDGHEQTVAWFIQQGYNITATSNLEVYLTR